MESSVNTVIISVLGAGLIGMFGYFLRRITSDIQSLGARLEKRIDKLENSRRGDALGYRHSERERCCDRCNSSRTRPATRAHA